MGLVTAEVLGGLGVVAVVGLVTAEVLGGLGVVASVGAGVFASIGRC